MALYITYRHRLMTYVQLTTFAFSFFVFAHAQAQDKTVYRSEADTLATVRKISLLPVFDNMRGIYSRPIESYLQDSLKQNHHFEVVESNSAGAILAPEEIEESPNQAKEIAKSLEADAFISAKVVKGPAGISMTLSLFLTKDAKLFAKQELNGIQRLDIDGLKKQADDLLNKLLRSLPYEGVILSRQGTRVTVNLGKRDGVVADQVVSVIQIIKLNRHPKFNFLVGTEKEILGKIRLLKIDDTLSFGRIVTEKEAGSIQVNAKVGGIDSVTYTNTDSLSDERIGEGGITDRPEAKSTYGEKPTEWVPTKKPSFGEVGARLGLGQFSENIKTTTQSLNSDAAIYPFVVLEGELWLTPEWSLHASMRQGILSTGNPANGPKNLDRNLASYEFMGGYNIRLGAGTWAPRLEALAGFATYELRTDKTSNAAITTKTYGGLKLGISGYYPIGLDSRFAAGARFLFSFDPHLSEDPGSSGRDDNSVNQFGLFLDRKLQGNLKARFGLDFESYITDFSGASVRSASQKHTTLTGGISYQF